MPTPVEGADALAVAARGMALFAQRSWPAT